VPLGDFFVRGAFHKYEKPAPFSREVKIAAPENSTQTRNPGPPARRLEMNLISDFSAGSREEGEFDIPWDE
jgi:hypothetical protein